LAATGEDAERAASTSTAATESSPAVIAQKILSAPARGGSDPALHCKLNISMLEDAVVRV
jgi:hypothetical protein